jgi:hypothetical protein
VSAQTQRFDLVADAEAEAEAKSVRISFNPTTVIIGPLPRLVGRYE